MYKEEVYVPIVTVRGQPRLGLGWPAPGRVQSIYCNCPGLGSPGDGYMYDNRTDTNILSRPFGVLVNLLPRTLHVPGSNPPRASGFFLHFYKKDPTSNPTPALLLVRCSYKYSSTHLTGNAIAPLVTQPLKVTISVGIGEPTRDTPLSGESGRECGGVGLTWGRYTNCNGLGPTVDGWPAPGRVQYIYSNCPGLGSPGDGYMYDNRTDTNILSRPFVLLVNLLPP